MKEKSSVEVAFIEIMNTIRNQDELIHSWTRSYITIQSGLIVAVGFLFKYKSGTTTMLWNIGPILVAVLGIAFAFILTNVIVREHKWQGHFIGALRRLPEIPEIYERDPTPNMPGYIAKQFLTLRLVIIFIWVTIALIQIGLSAGILPQPPTKSKQASIERSMSSSNIPNQSRPGGQLNGVKQSESTSSLASNETTANKTTHGRLSSSRPVMRSNNEASSALVKELKSINQTIKESSKPSIFRDVFFIAIGAVISGLAGVWIPALERYRKRPILRIADDKVRLEGKHLSLRVENIGKSSAINVAGYLSIDATKSDVLADDPRGKNTNKPYVIPTAFRQIEQEGLCWALIGNPHQRNIYPGTFAILDIFAFEPNTVGQIENILLPTENGWEKLRAALRAKKYTGRLVLALENSEPLIQNYEIDIIDNEPRLKLL